MAAESKRILVVDDEQNMRVALFEALRRNGFDVSVAENGMMALDLIAKTVPDAVITDIKMPEMDGIELLRRIKALHADLPVIIITGYATVDTAVKAMKLGAFDYILKPFSVEVIEETINRVFGQLPAVNPPGRKEQKIIQGAGRPIVGKDPKLMALLEKARAVASSKATVLILGESGTGKEVIARYIHEQSNRQDEPFVALNCAALPEGLLESELFGHERGAFTGAIATKKGRFEQANNGTLLLDEIGEIPLHLQAKLLRVLQEEEVDRLGGRGPVSVDVHVVATTNRDLAKAVENGSFRQDLFFRLNVIPLRLPSLRERRGDILLLAQFFIEKFCHFYNKPIKTLSPFVANVFLSYPWVGNVREMENLIERGVLLSTSEQFERRDFWDEDEFVSLGLGPISSSETAVPPADAGPLPDNDPTTLVTASNMAAAQSPFLDEDGEMTSLKEVERQMILQSLQRTDNNRTHAAKILGISVRTLRNKLQEYRSDGYVD